MKAFISLFLTALLWANVSLAAWSSGGGEILKDSENPWFIQNTEEISICIIWDENHFDIGSRDEKFLRDKISDAWAYWRDEFSRSFRPAETVQVATQSFTIEKVVRVSEGSVHGQCAPYDLTFQFGYLSDSQVRYFDRYQKSPKDFISIAVRTGYDTAELKGRGFVYFAADSGPWKLDGPDLIEHPWRRGQGGLLTAALKHELGHVFGIPHLSTSLMSASFLERIFSRQHALDLVDDDFNLNVFEVSREGTLRKYCVDRMAPVWARFLGVSGDHHRCYEYKLTRGRVEIWLGASENSLEKVGYFELSGQRTFSWSTAVSVYLPPEQNIIRSCPPQSCDDPTRVLGPMIKTTEVAGVYRSMDGRITRQAMATFSPLGVGDNYVKFSGILDGVLKSNLEWGR